MQDSVETYFDLTTTFHMSIIILDMGKPPPCYLMAQFCFLPISKIVFCCNTFTVTTVSNSRQDIFSWFVWKQSNSCLGVHPCFTEKISRSLKRVILVTHFEVTNFFPELTQKYQPPTDCTTEQHIRMFHFHHVLRWKLRFTLQTFSFEFVTSFFCFTNWWW